MFSCSTGDFPSDKLLQTQGFSIDLWVASPSSYGWLLHRLMGGFSSTMLLQQWTAARSFPEHLSHTPTLKGSFIEWLWCPVRHLPMNTFPQQPRAPDSKLFLLRTAVNILGFCQPSINSATVVGKSHTPYVNNKTYGHRKFYSITFTISQIIFFPNHLKMQTPSLAP